MTAFFGTGCLDLLRSARYRVVSHTKKTRFCRIENRKETWQFMQTDKTRKNHTGILLASDHRAVRTSPKTGGKAITSCFLARTLLDASEMKFLSGTGLRILRNTHPARRTKGDRGIADDLTLKTKNRVFVINSQNSLTGAKKF